MEAPRVTGAGLRTSLIESWIRLSAKPFYIAVAVPQQSYHAYSCSTY